MSAVVKKTLERLESVISPEALQQQNPCFEKLLRFIAEKDFHKFWTTIKSERFDINYQEPVRKNRSVLHYAAKENFLEAVHHLLQSKARCDVVDINGITPLHLAANEALPDVVNHLIRYGSSCVLQDERGRTALHWALTTCSVVDDENSNNILRVVKSLLVHSNVALKDSEGRLPLHMAVRSGLTCAVKLLLNDRKSANVSTKDKELLTPLHYAVISAQSLEIVSLLIKSGANLDAVDKTGQTPMHHLVGRKPANVDETFDVACLEILLSSGASVSIADENDVTPLSSILSRTMWYSRGSSRDFYLTIVQMLVAKGAKLTCSFTMWRMIDAFPSLLNYTLNHSITTNTSVHNSVHLTLEFDMRCFIEKDKLKSMAILHQKTANEEIELPFSLNSFTDVTVLHYLAHSGNKHILRHPLCRSFLHLKWLRIRKFFVVNFIVSCLFVFSLSFFVLSISNCKYSNSNDNDKSFTDSLVRNDASVLSKNETSSSPSFLLDRGNQTWLECFYSVAYSGEDKLVSWIILFVMYVVFLVREIFQIKHCPLHRLASFKQAMIICLIVFAPILLVHPCPCDSDWWTQVAAIVVVGGWITLLLSLGQFPTFGVYVVMFSTVAENVLKFLGLYMLLIVGFALGFHVLLRPYQTFYSLFLSLSTTFVMMTGELDYEAVFVQEGKSSEIFGILLLLFFIFLVYIILSNLLVGLAVSDLTAIRKKSEVMRLCSQVELMVQFEEVVRSNLWPKCIQDVLLKSISLRALSKSPIINVQPNKTRGWVTRSFKFMANFVPKRALNKIFESFVDGFIAPEWEPQLPESILKSSLRIAQKQFEVQKRDRLLKERHFNGVLNTVIAKMPMPSPSRKTVSQMTTPACASTLFDISEGESDDSTDSNNWDSYPDVQPFLDKKFLTLRKSSRRNLMKGLRSLSSAPGVSGTETEDVRVALAEIQAVINSFDHQECPLTNTQTRRSISRCSKTFPVTDTHV
ncbi:Ankyrin repeat-containing domain [Trinorchestia longiramus]|nr:Ankyrin repeat-containing domain [Trinorchestia longiramus]